MLKNRSSNIRGTLISGKGFSMSSMIAEIFSNDVVVSAGISLGIVALSIATIFIRAGRNEPKTPFEFFRFFQ